MTDSASGKHNGSGAPGRPIQPGQVLNPKGANQYTYKRDFELTIGRLLKGELSPEEMEAVPGWVRDLITPGVTRGEAIAAVTLAGALRGDPKHLMAVLERLWPKVQTIHTGQDPESDPMQLEARAQVAELSPEGREAIQKVLAEEIVKRSREVTE